MIIPTKKKRRHKYVETSFERRTGRSDIMIRELINTVINNGDDPTSDYHDWFRLGCALAKSYGQGGRDLFQKLSSNYHNYDPAKVDEEYNKILKLGSWNSDKGTIVYILSQYQ